MLSIRDHIAQMKDFLQGHLSKKDCKLVYHDSADVSEILASGIGNKKYRIATSGYSAGQEGYKETTAKFLKKLDKLLGRKNTGYITTPAVSDGSIYDITTQVSGLGTNNIAYFTTEKYWASTDFGSFNKDMNLRQYTKTPIHIFPDTATYTQATANASNVLICTGGRKVAVTEIVEALKRKSKVVLLINENLNNEGFDKDTQQVENAAKYFVDYTLMCRKDLPRAEQLDIDFLTEHPGRAVHLLRVYFVNERMNVKDAAVRASKFIESKTLYDYCPDKTDEIDKDVAAATRIKDRQGAIEHFIKTGEMNILYK